MTVRNLSTATLLILLSACIPTASAQSAPTRNSLRALIDAPDTPAVRRSIARLTLANLALGGEDRAAARRQFELVAQSSDAPEHHRWEARRRLAELDRVAKGLPPRDPAASRTSVAPLPAPVVTLHVAAEGNDENPGTREKPFATLERARNELRDLRKTNRRKGSAQVLVHPGRYAVTRTLDLTAEDSGRPDAPVVYRAAGDVSPTFRGGVRLNNFKPVTDSNLLARIPEGARRHVLRLDLGEAGVKDLLPLKLGGFASGNGFKTHPAHELFFDGKAMQLARGPNSGFLHIQDVAVKDGTKGYDRSGSKVGQFYCESDLLSKWKEEKDLMLYGYWFWDWADSYERVASIDAEKKLITLAAPYHTYGYSAGAPFYAINALCELDSPGEWYIDRSSNVLYFYPPSDVAKGTVELSTFDKPMLTLNNVSHVRFERLTWELGSADAVHATGGEKVLFAGCAVRRFAGNAISINGGKGHGVLSCDVYSMGRGGISISGGDRKALSPSGHFVENCDVHELSRIDHTYTPAVAVAGVGVRVAHNRLHDILSSAMRVGGNDHVIEYNDVYRAVLESDDQGAADMWGNATYRGNVYRYNYWRQIGSPFGPEKGQPKLGQAGIRLDDAISGTLIYGNVFEQSASGKTGFGAVQIHGGKGNVIDNNLFIDNAIAVSFSAWKEERWLAFIEKAMEDRAIDKELYLKTYPDLAGLRENANLNHLWRNRVVRCGVFMKRNPKDTDLIDNTVGSEVATGLDRSRPLNLPGMASIPLDEMGLYADGYRVKGEGTR